MFMQFCSLWLQSMMSYPVHQQLEFESFQRLGLTAPPELNMTRAIISLILLLHWSQGMRNSVTLSPLQLKQ